MHYEQFAALALARWQAFRNSLRVTRSRYEAAARVIVVVLGVLAALLIGLSMGGMTYAALARGRPAGLGLITWTLFNLWQFGSLVTEGSSPAVRFNQIARYPISFRFYYWLNTFYGLLDPVALLSLVGMLACWVAVVFARPGWADRTALLLAAFALVNLFFNRVLFSFLERVMSTRKGRERLMLAVLVFAGVSQFAVYVLLPSKSETMQQLMPLARGLHAITPPGLVAHGIMGSGSARAALALAGYAALAALLLRRQLWRNYRGEIRGEDFQAAAEVQVRPGWQFPLLGQPAAAILEKELRYTLRDARTIMAFLSAPAMALLVMISSEFSTKVMSEVAGGSSVKVFAGSMGYAVLALGALSYNTFSYESHGFRFWQMAPVDFRSIFAVKNGILAALLAANYVILALMLNSAVGLGQWDLLLVAIGSVYAILAVIAWGNVVSVRYPMRVEYGTLSTRQTSSVAVLATLFTQLFVLVSVAVLFYAGARLNVWWVPHLGLVLLAMVAYVFYRWSLDNASRYAAARGDEIATRVA